MSSGAFHCHYMPTAAPKPCSQCGALVRDGTTRCDGHKRQAGSFADRTRGTRHERGYGAAWDRIRARVMRRDAGLCQPSLRHGLVVQATAVDHKVPKAQGGTDAEDNLQAISAAVHTAKTNAEKLGRAWDESAWFAGGGGGQISGKSVQRTEQQPNFRQREIGVRGG